jgi:short subunit dehydrogenase-like uncharacterized protein
MARGTAAYGAWGRYWRAAATPPATAAAAAAAGSESDAAAAAAAEAEKRAKLQRLQRQLQRQLNTHPIDVDEPDATHDAFQPITVMLTAGGPYPLYLRTTTRILHLKYFERFEAINARSLN